MSTRIFAHRGASGDAPENTLEAFELAAGMGAHGVELDVHICRSGELRSSRLICSALLSACI